MAVRGKAVLKDHSTDVSVSDLQPNSGVNLAINYIDELGSPSFVVAGYTTTEADGTVAFTLPVGKLDIEAITKKDIDRVEVNADVTFKIVSRSD